MTAGKDSERVHGVGNSPDASLRAYERDKFAIAAILRAAAAMAPKDARDWRQRVDNLFARLAEDRFNVVFVGRFSRGKTSLMNAILGTDHLPTGIVPLTSVITTVGYGTTENVTLHFRGRSLDEDVSLDDLPQYITQAGNPGNARGIETAEIRLRAEILRRGFLLVDTPGLGSAIAENTRTTEGFLAEADAFVLVSSYESPLSEEEMRVLRAAMASGRTVFVIINKQDLSDPRGRGETLSYVHEQLRSAFGQNGPKVFSVSAHQAIEGKRSADGTRVVESGITAIEEALVDFVVNHKRIELLRNACARAVGLLQELADQDLVAQMQELTERVVGDRTEGHTSAVEATVVPGLRQLRTCEVCQAVSQALWDFLRKFQYDISINRDAQRRLAEAGGLCSFHTWQYESLASPYGTCTGYPTLLDRIAASLRDAASVTDRATAGSRMRALLPARNRCAACDVRAEIETRAICELASRLAMNANALDSLSALCLPHLAMLSAALSDEEVVRRLLKQEALLLERLSEDMQRNALKQDGTRRFLASTEEETAAERALLILAGHRNVDFVCEEPRTSARNLS